MLNVVKKFVKRERRCFLLPSTHLRFSDEYFLQKGKMIDDIGRDPNSAILKMKNSQIREVRDAIVRMIPIGNELYEMR